MTEQIDRHARDRIKHPFMTWRDETPAQRAAVHQRRVEQALIENPEWSNEKIGEEWGISPELVALTRMPEGKERLVTHEQAPKTYVQRVAAELDIFNAAARAIAALKNAMGRKAK